MENQEAQKIESPLENQSTGTNPALLWGLYMGVGLAFIAIAQMYTSSAGPMKWLWQVLGFVALIGGAVMAMRAERERRGGFISFGAAFGKGFLATVIGSLIVGLVTFVMIQWVYPGYLDKLAGEAMEQLGNMEGFSEEQIEMSMGMAKIWLSSWMLSFGAFFNNIFWGVIICLISAAVVKRNNPMPFISRDEDDGALGSVGPTPDGE